MKKIFDEVSYSCSEKVTKTYSTSFSLEFFYNLKINYYLLIKLATNSPETIAGGTPGPGTVS